VKLRREDQYEKEMDGSSISDSDVFRRRNDGFCGVGIRINRRSGIYGIFEYLCRRRGRRDGQFRNTCQYVGKCGLQLCKHDFLENGDFAPVYGSCYGCGSNFRSARRLQISEDYGVPFRFFRFGTLVGKHVRDLLIMEEMPGVIKRFHMLS